MRAAVKEPQLVTAPSNMTDENFRLHMIHRHGYEISDANFTWDVAQPYRAMHRREHLTGGSNMAHRHSEEPPEAAVEFALACLMENRMWGWREIAGTEGVVAAHPNGSWAIRIGTEIRHYNQVERAARILMKGRFVK